MNKKISGIGAGEKEIKRLYKSRKDRMIDGVCGGLAEYLGIDSTIVRVIWVLISLFGGTGILAYIVCMIVVPERSIDSKEEESKKVYKSGNRGMFWGILLVIIGVIFLLREINLFPFRFSYIWHASWGYIWPVFLIILGFYILLRKPVHTVEVTGKEVSAETVGRVFRSKKDKKIAGVCGGLAEYFNIDPSIIRVIWVLGTFASIGLGILAYVILALVLPEKTD